MPHLDVVAAMLVRVVALVVTVLLALILFMVAVEQADTQDQVVMAVLVLEVPQLL
jgi:hypothetical protein